MTKRKIIKENFVPICELENRKMVSVRGFIASVTLHTTHKNSTLWEKQKMDDTDFLRRKNPDQLDV